MPGGEAEDSTALSSEGDEDEYARAGMREPVSRVEVDVVVGRDNCCGGDDDVALWESSACERPCLLLVLFTVPAGEGLDIASDDESLVCCECVSGLS